MFESLLKIMPSILDDLKNDNVEKEYVDVTTDEGIKKVRDSVYNIKGNIKSLEENLRDSWFPFIWDTDVLDSINKSLDETLERAEKKYKEAKSKKSDSTNNYVRPVLRLESEDASKAYRVVDEYLEKQICPRLKKDTTSEFVQSIRESLADFAAWLALNKY